ncbi:hypothetical protein C0991_001138 [Blastosporella zonata]|nr:hypothetical protein C0991_001138 [Blastosporella zonata]
MLSSKFTALLVLVPFVSANVIPSLPIPAFSPNLFKFPSFSASKQSPGLHTFAREAGKIYFGSATDNLDTGDELLDLPYAKILSDNQMFGQISPEYVEPVRGQFNFTMADQLVAWAEKNGQIMRGHNCVWYNQLPDWVTAGNFSAPELAEIVATHCGTEVGHFRGKIWDVINEPFNDDGTWRETVFYNTLNTTYIPIALEAARRADPGAKLYINDYNIEGPGAKSTAMINLVKKLKEDRVPIDGVGIQGHLIVGELPANIEDNIRAIVATGVEVAITELDIRMTLPATEALLAQQKIDYNTVITACQNVKGCIGVTVWDYTDRYTWVPSTFPGQGAPCPWDDNLERKPAWSGIAEGFGQKSL